MYNFFEHPSGFWARFVQVFIFVLIIVALGVLVLEFWYPQLYQGNRQFFHQTEYLILGVFTLEYVLRFVASQKKWQWAKRPSNIIDFLAVFPTYLEFALHLTVNTSGLRVIRVLRLFRALRLLKLFKYGGVFQKVFRYKNTILESIMPVMVFFVVAKVVIWALEYYGFWIRNTSLGELFAIIGFALGIILSQKIGASYDKFLQVEEGTIRLYGTLRSLMLVLDRVEPGLGDVCTQWARRFLEILEDPHANNFTIANANASLYAAMAKAEGAPSELSILHGEIMRDASFCLSKKMRLTPKPYDTLLHQATMLYLGLIAVFIPGMTGLLSVVVATYILYGMYNLTQDFDSIVGGEFNLININISELQYFAQHGNKV